MKAFRQPPIPLNRSAPRSLLPRSLAPRFLVHRWVLIAAVAFAAGQAVSPPPALAQAAAHEGAAADRQVHVVRIPLPIDQRAANQVLQLLERIAEQAAAAPRPLVILQFDTDRGGTGAGSSLPDCLRLARFLTRTAPQRMQVVAYVPGLIDRTGLGQPGDVAQSQLVGHAVLVALVAEELALEPSVVMGDATLDESTPAPEDVNLYRDYASLRMTLPVSIVESMVDPAKSLHAVVTTEGERLATREELQQLEREGLAIQSETLSVPGRTSRYNAEQLDRFGVNVHRVADRQQLAIRYGVDLSTIEIEAAERREWRAVKFEFPNYISQRSVAWAQRALEADLRADEVNLILLSFDSEGGELSTSLQLARYLSDFDPDKVRTVAFLPRTCAGPAAIAALACDHLIFTEETQLGGAYDPPLTAEELAAVRVDLERIARARNRDVALLQGMLDPQLELARVRHQRTGQVRWVVAAEWNQAEDRDQWSTLELLTLEEGLRSNRAEADRLARTVLRDWQQVESFYQLASPAKVLTPTGVDQFINWLARTLATPSMAFLLLFGGMFLISTEMSSPGLGVPGFLGALCFVLFFWSQHLDGNAGWLEVLLFMLGIAFIAMELFILPGVGIFGIGGLLLVVTSLVLATQTFIIPSNSRELQQLPQSLGMVAAALSGLVVAMVLMRRYLPQAPLFRRLMLEPPPPESESFAGAAATAVSIGERGVTVTRLLPTGKAKIGGKVVDVISDGEIVEPREAIEVVESVANRIVVRAVEKRT